MSKFYFAIDYRNMHTGVHGLLLYEDRATAEKEEMVIKSLFRNMDKFERGIIKNKTSEEMSIMYELTIKRLFEEVFLLEEDVDYRDIVWVIKHGSHKKEYKHRINDKLVRVINITYDLYV